jgi:mitochondrial translocator assembly and maintenance protein 41
MTELPFDKDNLLKKYSPLEFAMVYGSSVFKQESYTEKDKPMIDLIFAVNSTPEWHEINLIKNSGDYSLQTRMLGLGFINIMEKLANVYYNVNVPFQERKIKYGIISLKNLMNDLTGWETLYVSGRLHKPTKILKSNEMVNGAIKANLEHAINTSLLLLPENFTKEDFYMEIAGISYTKDLRWKFFAENKNKVKNIVKGNLNGFDELYGEIIKKQYSDVINLNGEKIEQDKSPKTQQAMYNKLPVNLITKIKTPINFESKDDIRSKVLEGIKSIVFWPSVMQPAKGFLVTDLPVSLMYVFEKFKKNFRK